MGNSLTYPAPPPTVQGDAVQIHRLLKTPSVLATRLRTILQQRYIADAILTGRYVATGGAILFESGEPLFTDDEPKAVAPGSEYPLTQLGGGVLSTAKVTKWGQDSWISDEAIARMGIDPVQRALSKLANSNVRHVDSVAMSVALSATPAQNTSAASGKWSDPTTPASAIFRDVALASARIEAQGEGFTADTVVLDSVTYAAAMSQFVADGLLPREPTNGPLYTGTFPNIGGKTWLTSPHFPTGNGALLLDSAQFGGMADEDLGGPGYVSAAGPGTAAVQVKTIRDDQRDGYGVRSRRVTVPVVVEPYASWRITGVA